MWFTALRPNEGKTFAAFALSVWKVLKKAVAQLKICQETFAVCQKSVKTTKLFSRLAFVVYGVYIMMVLHCNAHYYANITVVILIYMLFLLNKFVKILLVKD